MKTGKGLKKATNEGEYKVMIPSLNKEDVSITTNKERILEGCSQFYLKLYEDTVQDIAKLQSEEGQAQWRNTHSCVEQHDP